jgi:hypothetical protein
LLQRSKALIVIKSTPKSGHTFWRDTSNAMTACPELVRLIEHGEACECRALAAALGVDPRTMSYRYCHDVLQKHWRLICRHGDAAPSAGHPGLSGHWRGLGPVDPIKAILISNDQGDDT